ncbi:MAG TPA: type IX secretion system membrane protein PorP/SprF, partial [Bacteroidia bacterium]|nr:type IX secretion system membrane protein PorP/SprF [Bacteroidia bacterium]
PDHVRRQHDAPQAQDLEQVLELAIVQQGLNYKERMFGGFSIRMGDAIALHVGISFLDDFQVSYSYDFLISRLRNVSAGSHEITLVYSTNFTHSKHGRIDDRFLRQKYGYLF